MRSACSYEHVASGRDDGWDAGIPCYGLHLEVKRNVRISAGLNEVKFVDTGSEK